jgi:2,3-bisphosphoglycerate-independent phosphoglycerate mutase
MKYVILHAEGMADHPRQELAGKTPLQAATTPHLDRLAQRSELGLLTVALENGRHGSGLTGTSILGYEPRKYYQGPGPFEAASLGVAVGENDVVYRCTMVTLKPEQNSCAKGGSGELKKLGPHIQMDDSTAGLISSEEARELIDAVNEQLGSETIQFYPGSGHRHLMVWVDGKPRAVCADPQALVGRSIADALPSGDGADVLRKLMDASLVILRDHPVNDERRENGQKPANCLWLWGEGRAIPWPSFTERFKVSGAVVSPSDVHRGLGLVAGLEAPSAEQPAKTDLRAQAIVALDQLKRKDFVYVHVELPDEVVYDTDVKAKIRATEEVDREFIGPLMDGLDKMGPYRLVVLSDPGSVHQGKLEPGQWFYAYYDSMSKGAGSAVRRFTESDAQASAVPPRDATKFVVRLFAKVS